MPALRVQIPQVGFSWEKAFHLCVEDVASTTSNPLVMSTALAAAVVAVVTPAWKKYILPTALRLVEEKEDAMGGGASVRQSARDLDVGNRRGQYSQVATDADEHDKHRLSKLSQQTTGTQTFGPANAQQAPLQVRALVNAATGLAAAAEHLQLRVASEERSLSRSRGSRGP